METKDNQKVINIKFTNGIKMKNQKSFPERSRKIILFGVVRKKNILCSLSLFKKEKNCGGKSNDCCGNKIMQ